MPIYTRGGDKGKTALFNGKRVFKSHIRVDTYGTIDELNSTIGSAIAESQRSKVKNQRDNLNIKNELEKIQHDLLDIGSALAFPSSPPVYGLEERVKVFEKLIDEMTEKMPTLKNFILPGGGKAAAALHIARTICRRAERRIVELMQQEDIDESIVKYINRLSDVLFTMARFANHIENKKDVLWRKK